MSLINRGCDPLDVMIDRAHEVGMDFIGSLRLTHSSNPADVTNAHNWQFKIDHPEWVLKGDDSPNRKNAFNWTYPEVRAERFAIAEETLTRYDVDGLELDLTFDPYYFEADEVADNLHVLTDFIRDLRRAAKESGEKRGKSIDIGARVFPTLKANNDAGFDVETWLQEGLLDFVVPNVYSHMPIDPDFPFEVLLDLARAGGCEVYPAMGSVLGGEPGRVRRSGLLSRRGFGLLESRGGCSLPAMVPVAHRPGAAADPLGDRRSRRAVREAEALLHGSTPGPVRQVRIRGSPTRSARCRSRTRLPATVCLTVAKDSAEANVTLTLKLGESTSHDEMSVSINEIELSLDDATYTTYGYDYSTLEFQLDWDDLVDGANGIIHRRPRPAGQTVECRNPVGRRDRGRLRHAEAAVSSAKPGDLRPEVEPSSFREAGSPSDFLTASSIVSGVTSTVVLMEAVPEAPTATDAAAAEASSGRSAMT